MLPRLAVCFVFCQVLSAVTAAPVVTPPKSGNETVDCNEEHSDVYDQRQNGTENYRIHVNGVVVLVAPAETVLQAAQLGDLQLLTENESSSSSSSGSSSSTSPVLKPKPKPPSPVDKVPSVNSPSETYPHTTRDHNREKSNNLKLINLLHMFRSIKHDTEVPSNAPQH